jgi:AraC-like DNA-binding protein/mannose-6-phosphate isomerase-like protein (cupin superfamily)
MQVRNERITHPDESFRVLRVEADGFGGPHHRHPQLELTWIERGAGLRFLGDSVAPFAADDLVLVGANVPHSWLGHATGDARSAVATVVQFPATLLEIDALPELRRARPIVERARLGLLVTGTARTAIIEVLRSLAGAEPFERLATLVRILGLLSRHPDDLAPIAASAMRTPDRADVQARLDRVTDWISRRVGRALTVAEAARVARVTPAAFSRFFRRESGKAFSVYVNDVRCGDACVKLGQSGKPIAQVAHECGFRSLANFNRQFRRRMGMTPRAYRRQR